MRLEWKTCLRVGVTAVAAYLIVHYWDWFIGALGLALNAAAPLITGAAIAYIVNIPMHFFERFFFPRSTSAFVRRIRRPVCLLLAAVCVALAVMFLVQTIIPELVRCVALLAERLPGALHNGYLWLNERFDVGSYITQIAGLTPGEEFDWQGLVTKALNLFISGFGGVMGAAVSVVSGVVSTLISLFLGIVFAVYLLFGKEKIGGQLHRVLTTYAGENFDRRARYLLTNLDQSFHSYIVGQCTEALILGSLCALGMLLFRFPYAVMIGALVGCLALIPIAGAYIAAAVGAFMIFTVSPLQSLLFLVFLVILQQIEGNLIFPRVVGSSIGLPGIWVLAAVTVGGGLMGIAGMVIAVPLTAAVYRMLGHDLTRRGAAPDAAPALADAPAAQDAPVQQEKLAPQKPSSPAPQAGKRRKPPERRKR